MIGSPAAPEMPSSGRRASNSACAFAGWAAIDSGAAQPSRRVGEEPGERAQRPFRVAGHAGEHAHRVEGGIDHGPGSVVGATHHLEGDVGAEARCRLHEEPGDRLSLGCRPQLGEVGGAARLVPAELGGERRQPDGHLHTARRRRARRRGPERDASP